MAEVWALLQRRSAYPLPPLDELDVRQAVQDAMTYEDVLHRFPEPPQQVLVEATQTDRVRQRLPPWAQSGVGVQGKKKKTDCEVLQTVVHNFTLSPNPVALVYFAAQCEESDRVFPIQLRHVFADEQATVIEGRLIAPLVSDSVKGKGGSATQRFALTPDTELLFPVSRTKRATSGKYIKDLYHRAVLAEHPDPFCTVWSFPPNTVEEFRVRITSAPVS